MHRQHMGMTDRGHRLGLGLEPPQKVGIISQARVEEFDRNLTAESDVIGQVHPPRSAGTESSDQAIPCAEDPTDPLVDANRCHPAEGTDCPSTAEYAILAS